MEIISHEFIVTALENWTNRFTHWERIWGVDDCLVSRALDKTGMMDTSLLCNDCENNKQLALIEQQEKNRVMELGVSEEVLQVHGIAPASKLEGVIWLIYKNANGICNKVRNNN